VAARLHAELVLAREEAVDREVAPMSPLAYSQLLVDAAHFRAEQVVAMASGDLARRIARLTDETVLPRARLVAALACFGVVAGAVLAFPRAAAAHPEQPVDLDTFHSQDAQIELDLHQGQQLTLADPGMRRIAVGDPTIADVKSLAGGRLQVTGGTPGATTLLVWDSAGARRSYEVTVSNNTPDPSLNTLPPQIDLTVGDELFIPFPAIQRVAVGDPQIVDIAANDDGLHLLPVSAGQTTLLVWGHGGRHQSLLSVKGPL
jgi:Flp pilus assembly secretin CpaC